MKILPLGISTIGANTLNSVVQSTATALSVKVSTIRSSFYQKQKLNSQTPPLTWLIFQKKFGINQVEGERVRPPEDVQPHTCVTREETKCQHSSNA